MSVSATAGQGGVAAPGPGGGVDEDGAGAAVLHLGRGRHHQRGDTVLVDVARGREYGLSLPARHGLGLLRVAVAGVLHLVDVGRAGAAGERRAGRAVRRAEGDLGEALAVLLVEPDQPVQLVLDVVHLGEREILLQFDSMARVSKGQDSRNPGPLCAKLCLR